MNRLTFFALCLGGLTFSLLAGRPSEPSALKTARISLPPAAVSASDLAVENMTAAIVRRNLPGLSPIDTHTHGTQCVSNGYISVCLAPGTPEAYARKILARLPKRAGGIGAEYIADDRWTSTITNGSTGSIGRSITLTYSFVPDGTALPSGNQGVGEPAANSTLFARLNALFGAGNEAVWRAKFAACFQRWGQLIGVKYVEVSDDGASLPNNNGRKTAPIRGDVRISMHPIDGVNGILAYNYFPNTSDMVLDAAENWAQTANDYRFLRNIVMHEHGHGQGLSHVDSNNSIQLMEPFLSTSIDGPQDDDIRGGQHNYGDIYESASSGLPTENNDTAAKATPLGTFTGVKVVDNAATSTAGDVDWYVFDVQPASQLSVVLTPLGSTYNIGAQGGAQSATDTRKINNLDVSVFAANGTTLLASGNTQPAGSNETITGLNTTLSAGTKLFVKVANASGAQDATQRYKLTLTLALPTLTGTIQLEQANEQGKILRVEFRPKDGSAVFTQNATLSAAGTFSLPNIPARSYDIAIKGTKWLQKVVPVDLQSVATANISTTLLAGDASDDNNVNFDDFQILANAYFTTKNVDALYDARADFNEDDQVNFDDFQILADNYFLSGDP